MKLLAQYKSLLKLVHEDLDSDPSYRGLEGFMRRYRLDYPAALHRLSVGVPATVEHSAEAGQGQAEEHGKWVAETTQSFITFMDALKLNLRAKDQLHPFLTELMTNYSRFKNSTEWEGRGKILHWLIELNGMKASDTITEEQSRQVSLMTPASKITTFFPDNPATDAFRHRKCLQRILSVSQHGRASIIIVLHRTAAALRPPPNASTAQVPDAHAAR